MFAAFSGGHQDADARHGLPQGKGDHRWTCLSVDPDIGRTYDADVIRINNQSGKGGIGFVLEQNYGYNLPAKMREALGYKVKRVRPQPQGAERRRVLHIFEDTFLNKFKPLSVVRAHFAFWSQRHHRHRHAGLNGQRKVGHISG